MRTFVLTFFLLLAVATTATAARGPQLYSLSAGDPASPPPRGVHELALDRAALTEAERTGHLEVVLPNGRSYDVTVERTVRHPSGNRTLVGFLTATSPVNRVIVTEGAGGAFGRIDTPEGVFDIDTSEGRVRLVDTVAAGILPALRVGSDARPLPPAHVGSKPQRAAAQQQRAAAAATASSTIDLLVAYTPGLVSQLGSTSAAEARIDYLVTVSNQAMTDSGVGVTFRLVEVRQVAYTDSNDNGIALDDLTGISAGQPADFAAITQPTTGARDTYGADIVVLVRPYRSAQNGCGIAWVGGWGLSDISFDDEYAFAVVGNQTGTCSVYSFVHEIGHVMGSMHDRATVKSQNGGVIEYGAYTYSFGYGVSGVFGTIMSYIYPIVGKFSTPNLSCPGGNPCGVSETSVNSAYNVLSLNNTRDAVAAFRPTRVTDPVPAVTLAPSSVAFGSQNVGTTSAPTTVTLTNSGGAALTLNALSITGTNAAEFSRGGTCTPTTTLAAGASCTIAVTFAPTTTGGKTASVTLRSNATPSTSTVPLSGTATAPAATVTPTNLSFGSQKVGATSATQPVTLQNSGTGPMTINSITLTGDFGMTTTCGATLAAGANCRIDVAFTPVVAGARAGSMAISTNAAGSPHGVTLAGTGTLAPVITSAPPTGGEVGTAYTHAFAASGTAPIVFALQSGTLPAGLTLTSGGVLSGTPTTPATYNGTVSAANGTLPNATQAFSITIAGKVQPFAFVPATGVPINSYAVSNAIAVTGVATSVPISVTGGEYSVDGGAFTSAGGTIAAGQLARVRLITAPTFGTAASATLTIGGTSASFVATTGAFPACSAPLACSECLVCRLER